MEQRMAAMPENIDALHDRLAARSLARTLVALLKSTAPEAWEAELRAKIILLVEDERKRIANAED